MTSETKQFDPGWDCPSCGHWIYTYPCSECSLQRPEAAGEGTDEIAQAWRDAINCSPLPWNHVVSAAEVSTGVVEDDRGVPVIEGGSRGLCEWLVLMSARAPASSLAADVRAVEALFEHIAQEIDTHTRHGLDCYSPDTRATGEAIITADIERLEAAQAGLRRLASRGGAHAE